jgi:hypothetical protein
VIVLLMAIELMLLAVNMNFVAFSHYLGDMSGQVFVFFILTVAAAESAIGLAILVCCSATAARSTSTNSTPQGLTNHAHRDFPEHLLASSRWHRSSGPSSPACSGAIGRAGAHWSPSWVWPCPAVFRSRCCTSSSPGARRSTPTSTPGS